jgi:hypothetical protein
LETFGNINGDPHANSHARLNAKSDSNPNADADANPNADADSNLNPDSSSCFSRLSVIGLESGLKLGRRIKH